MKATRPAVLTAIVVGVALVTWAVVRLAYVSLPPLPWTAVPTLLLLALGEAFTGITLRGRIAHKPDTKPVEPMVVARMAALAKASSHAAAVLAGVFGGFVLYLAASLDKTTPRHDFFVSVGTFVAAVILVGAALVLEYCCRVPKEPDEEQDRTRL
ncbi:MAG: hypothetical protein JWO67_3638 [Streptosporangiaceae bacterium]|nr:hypothetical protein [Streptosporangiaceae bacterium]